MAFTLAEENNKERKNTLDSYRGYKENDFDTVSGEGVILDGRVGGNFSEIKIDCNQRSQNSEVLSWLCE